jgi:2-dehydropantoate 2-reductase
MGPYQPSSLVDYLAGREVEVEAIWGEPLRRAQALGVRMPRLAALYARLKAKCPGPRRTP